jgi:hypothetical protein
MRGLGGRRRRPRKLPEKMLMPGIGLENLQAFFFAGVTCAGAVRRCFPDDTVACRRQITVCPPLPRAFCPQDQPKAARALGFSWPHRNFMIS